MKEEEWRTDGQTDMTKLIITFRNFAKASEIFSSINLTITIVTCAKLFSKTFNILTLKSMHFYNSTLF